jgi:hypothetical protein
MTRRVRLAQHARKGPPQPLKPNRNARRSPIDGVALFAALAELRTLLERVLEELRRKS